MQNVIKNISIFLFLISGFLFPFLSIGIFLGLGSPNPQYMIMFGIAYLGFIFFSFVSIFNTKFFLGVIISFVLILSVSGLDYFFPKEHNKKICESVRSNPTCIEDICEFKCSEYPIGSNSRFRISGSVCKDKDMTRCYESFETTIVQ